MAIVTFDISEAQKSQILFLEETHFCDLKAIEISPAKLSRTIGAFANADGGELYIGIAEDKSTGQRSWAGFTNMEAANGHLQPFEQLFPLGGDFEYSFLRSQGDAGLVLQVQVRKTGDIKRATDREVYIRRGAQNLRVDSPEALRRLEYTKGISSFENETLAIPIEAIENSLPILEFMLGVVPTGEPGTWLAKQRLIRESKPTVGGILLFSESPQADLPKRCGIKLYRYRTKDSQGSRETLAFTPVTVEGHLYTQIRDAVAQTTTTIEETRRLGDASLEQIQYPSEALHEIITNAVLHRDYSIADGIHIRVFDNRVEVQSPGRLPAHITVENILDERFARKAPRIEERPNSVLVIIKHESLASPEQLILEFLETNDSIRNKQARDLCSVNADYVIKRIFGQLVDRGLIEQIPGTERATTAYRKGQNFGQWRQEHPQADDA